MSEASVSSTTVQNWTKLFNTVGGKVIQRVTSFSEFRLGAFFALFRGQQLWRDENNTKEILDFDIPPDITIASITQFKI